MNVSEAIIIDTEGLDRHVVQRIRDAVAGIVAEANGQTADPEAVRGWTAELAANLDSRLRLRGRAVQADVIAATARDGGFVDRDSVYRIGRYDHDRRLTGFTKPIRGVMRELVDEGLLPETAICPLTTEYDPSNAATQITSGFSMPADLSDVFARAVG